MLESRDTRYGRRLSAIEDEAGGKLAKAGTARIERAAVHADNVSPLVPVDPLVLWECDQIGLRIPTGFIAVDLKSRSPGFEEHRSSSNPGFL